jgi:hypothetical protein
MCNITAIKWNFHPKHGFRFTAGYRPQIIIDNNIKAGGRDMRKIVLGVVFIVSAVCLQAQNFSWDIKFLQGRNRESKSVSEPIKMETGDDFLITIKPDADCYCYVVCYDSERKIYVLKNEYAKSGYEIFLKPVDITDPPGTETVYVIMSPERQTKLETLIQAHAGNPNSQQHTNNLYREVVSLHTTVSNLGELAHSFISGGGTNRSGSDEYINRFSGKNLDVRRIIIRH